MAFKAWSKYYIQTDQRGEACGQSDGTVPVHQQRLKTLDLQLDRCRFKFSHWKFKFKLEKRHTVVDYR